MASYPKSNHPLLVVVSSPSGGGKTTVIRHLLKRHSDFHRSVSVTTRPKRAGEKEGHDYHFVSERQFRRLIKQRALLEWAQVHGNFYGTPRHTVDKASKHGWTVLFSLDVQGALSVKKKYPRAVLIFLLPPSWPELKRRLLSRNSDPKEALSVRLRNAKRELKAWKKYDYLVVNRKLSETVSQIESILLAERCRISRIKTSRIQIDV